MSGVLDEMVCPAHDEATVAGLCARCLDEARDAVLLVESGVAAARAWAEKVLRP